MKINRKGIKILFRISCCFLTSILISGILLGSINTYSWFSSKIESNTSVSAAEEKDILEKIEVVTDCCGNATKIRLKKNPDYEGNPIIYFGVDGVADQFTVHIDPVKLDTDAEIERDIEVNATLIQLDQMPHRVNGLLKVYYLNGYIYKEIPIEFTDLYIWWNRLGWQFKDEVEYQDSISISMLRLAEERSWEEAKWQDYMDNPVRLLSLSAQKSSIKSDASMKLQDSAPSENDISQEPIAIEKLQNPISELQITEEQSQLLDVIVPKLSEYIGRLYNTVEDLINKLNDKIEEIAQLELRVKELEDQNTQIEQEKADLQKDYDELIIIKEDYTVEIQDLTKKNEELSEENQKLKDKVDKLKNRNEKSNSKNDSLNDTISELQKEIDKLNAQIDELKDDKSSGGSSGGKENDNPGDDSPEDNPGEDNPEDNPGEDNPEDNPGEDNPEDNPGDDNPADNPGDDNPEDNPGDDNPADNPGDDSPADNPGDDNPEDNPGDDNPADNPGDNKIIE